MVKSLKEFAESMSRFDVQIIFEDRHYKEEELKAHLAQDIPHEVGLYSIDENSGDWSTIDPDDEYYDLTQEEKDMSFYEIVAQHLTEDAVAVFQEVGAEKARYLCGYAVAIRHDLKTLDVSIDDIFVKVQEQWGKEPTLCQY